MMKSVYTYNPVTQVTYYFNEEEEIFFTASGELVSLFFKIKMNIHFVTVGVKHIIFRLKCYS